MCDIIYKVQDCATGDIAYIEVNNTSDLVQGLFLPLGGTYSFSNNFGNSTGCATITGLGTIEACAGSLNLEIFPEPANEWKYMIAVKCNVPWAGVVGACKVTKDCRTIIQEKFAGAVHDKFTADRYGIKSCRIEHDPYFIYDLLTLEKRATELVACEKVLDCDCDCQKINERIKTL